MTTLIRRIYVRATQKRIKKHGPYIIRVVGTSSIGVSTNTLGSMIKQLLPDARIFVAGISEGISLVGYCSILLGSQKKLGWMHVCLKALFSSNEYDIYIVPYTPLSTSDIALCSTVVSPHMQIFTDVDALSTDGFGGVDETLEVYAGLLGNTKDVLFLPEDAGSLNDLMQNTSYDILTYGLKSNDATNVGFSGYSYVQDDLDGIISEFTIEQGDDTQVRICSYQLGEISTAYMSLGYEISCILGRRYSYQMDSVSLHDACVGTQTTYGTHMYPGILGSVLLHTPHIDTPSEMKGIVSTTIALRSGFYADKEIIYCLDMNEKYIGTHTEYAYRKIAPALAQSGDEIHLIGNVLHTYTYDEMLKLGYDDNAIYLHDSSQDMIEFLLGHLGNKQRCACISFVGISNIVALQKII